MGYEVEVKYRCVDHRVMAQRLAELGAELSASALQVDSYLSHPARDFAASNEAFRVRSIGNENRITYKGPRRPGPTKTREEIEIRFADGAQTTEQLLRLFELLGFRVVATIRKERTSYLVKRAGQSLEVALDRAESLGDFAEIEALAPSEPDLPAAQSAVLALAAELGLTEVEPRSYLRMVLEEKQ
jgi:adenylate cyclase class 2